MIKTFNSFGKGDPAPELRDPVKVALSFHPMPSPTPPPPESEDLAPDFPFPDWERYEPLGFLGEGCFGTVFKAWDRDLQRPVALKFLHTGDPSRTAALKQEAQAQARIEHPNFCRIYEVGVHTGRPYLAMQFLEGPSLEAAAPDLDLPELVALLAELAEAVDHGHRLGLTHRDLKANNILLHRDPKGSLHPCIVDFGQASLESPSAWTRKADLWALGEMAYTLLGGFPSGAGPSSLRRTPSAIPRPFLQEVNPKVPASLASLVSRSLELEGEGRFEDCAQWAKALRDWLAPPITRRRKGWLWGALALALIGSGLLYRKGLRKPPSPAPPPPPIATELQALRRLIEEDSRKLALLEARLESAQAGDRARLLEEIRSLRASLALNQQRLKALDAPAADFPPAGRPQLAAGQTSPVRQVPVAEAESVDRPARLLQRQVPAYPAEAFAAVPPLPDPLEVPVEVRVDAQGQAREARVPEHLPASLQSAAIQAALASRFEAASAGGEPIESWLRITYRFTRGRSEAGLGVLHLAPLSLNPEQFSRLKTLVGQGTLPVQLRIDAEGHPVEHRLPLTLPPDLEATVREALRNSRFSAAPERPPAGTWITVSFALRAPTR